jgi:hypothetical protein
VVLCIDVEPDPFVFDPGDPPPPWLGFEQLIEKLPALRRRLSDITGRPATFTWFLRMDPQVAETWGSPSWLANEYGGVFGDLTEAGDELGVHTHLWRWDRANQECFADFEDAAWSEYCLEMALDSFESAFGRACTAHRGGTIFLNGQMLSILTARGVSVDLTVEPGQASLGGEQIGEASRGRTPDYRRAPTHPYRTTPGRFPHPDPGARSGPLLVPLMSVRRKRPPFRRVPLPLWVPFATPNLVVELLRRPPVLALAMRTSSALEPEWSIVATNLERLAQQKRLIFMTATEAAQDYES